MERQIDESLKKLNKEVAPMPLAAKRKALTTNTKPLLKKDYLKDVENDI